MPNRAKIERNQKIINLWNDGKGWRQRKIARKFRMKEGAVQMVIARARKIADKSGNNGDNKGGDTTCMGEEPGQLEGNKKRLGLLSSFGNPSRGMVS